MPTWGAEWTATLIDLRTRRERQTLVSPTPEGLDVQTADGEWRRWPWTRVRQGEGTAGAVELVHEGECVRVADATMIDSIHRIAPRTRGQFKSASTRKIGILVAGYAAAIVGGLALVWFAIGWAGAWAAAAAPRSWEKRIGDEAIRQFTRGTATCGDRDLYLAVRSIAGRLTESAPAGEVAFDIRVVDEETLNAVTLPGGYIVIYRGLLRSAGTPEELAGVLAHEMQHAIQRHSMKALGREVALWSVIGLVTGGGDAVTTRMAGELAGLKMRREDEFAADEGALRMLEAAHIGSGGYREFFEKLTRSEGNVPWLGQAVSSHPDTRERIARIRAWESAHSYAVRPVVETDVWRRVRLRCR